MGIQRVIENVKDLRTTFEQFSKDENGATAIEYGLIVSLIFIAIIGSVRSYTDNASVMYSEIASSLN